MENGQQIRIFVDPWLPQPVSFKPIIVPTEEQQSLKVSSLINQITGLWDYSMISQFMWSVDLLSILEIPLSRRPVLDKIICPTRSPDAIQSIQGID